ncbi:MAG TPA: AMP-binding protein [Burkholderiales bacterium]|nr:AMP-binding protein [Burkholderiales bacterium]
MNVAAPLTLHTRFRAEHPAIVHGDRVLRYRELDPLVRRTASHLCDLGLKQGDAVGLALRDSVEHIVMLMALARAGLVIVPLDWRWTPEEQERVARHFAARLVLVEPDRPRPALRCMALDAEWQAAVARADAQRAFPEGGELPLCMSLSSGTTGRPKGPRHMHANFLARFRVFCVNLGFNAQDRYLSATPLYFGGGRSFAMFTLHIGATLYLFPPPYEPEALCREIARTRATALFLVPTIIRRLLALSDAALAPLGHLRLLVSSGSALHAEERREIRRRLCRGFMEYYSSTEGGGVSTLTAEDPPQFDESVGRPVFAVEVECVDENHRPVPPGEIGRIRYRGPGTATGYWNDPEASREAFHDGWFYPGDLGMLDEHGYLYIKGRAKDMIIRGGVNIYPAEVEAVLQSHPAVADSAVVGWPSREFNEEVAAFVILKQRVAADELRTLCRERLAPYKVPREVFVVDEFPRNTLGKVLKTELSGRLPQL